MISDSPPWGCLSLLALPFLVGGAAMTYVAADALVLHARSASWATVPATIELVELRDDGSDSKALEARYAYEWEGVVHRSDRPAAETGGSSDPVHAERAALLRRAMESGTTLPALVNPADPSEALLFREVRAYTLALLGAALLFFLVGLGAFVMLLRLGRIEAWRKRQATLHPGQPWRLEPHWEGNAVRTSAGKALWVLWGFAAFVGLMATPFVLVFGMDDKALRGRAAAAVLALLAVVLLGFAVRATVRYLRHGASTLVFEAFPLRPGRLHPGGVTWRYETSPQPVRCHLRCVHSTTETRTGVTQPRAQESEILHEERFEIPAAQWQRQDAGWWMPVTVRLPEDAATRSDRLRWWLEVSLTGDGVRASHLFDLPVFEVESRG